MGLIAVFNHLNQDLSIIKVIYPGCTLPTFKASLVYF